MIEQFVCFFNLQMTEQYFQNLQMFKEHHEALLVHRTTEVKTSHTQYFENESVSEGNQSTTVKI